MKTDKTSFENTESNTNDSGKEEEFDLDFGDEILKLIPRNSNEEVVHHKYYSLGYNEQKEQANWVAYVLTKESLQVPNVKRARHFKADYAVETRSSFFKDYSNSGYTKGHLAPAGDMAFSKEAMQESFFMSNISPQLRSFNNGIWKELEETVRNWAYKKDKLYVITGPLFYDKNPKKIGQNRVVVPDAFYKILIDKKGDDWDAISFIIPHEKSDQHLSKYASDIDDLEERARIEFLSDFFKTKAEENKVESSFNIKNWKFDENKFKQRVKSWNNQ